MGAVCEFYCKISGWVSSLMVRFGYVIRTVFCCSLRNVP
jgi:hypothetical protein